MAPAPTMVFGDSRAERGGAGLRREDGGRDREPPAGDPIASCRKRAVFRASLSDG